MYLLNHKSNDFSQEIVDSRLMKALFQPKLILMVLLFDLTQVPVWIEKYLFSDFSFLEWLVIIMILDFITGVTKVWVREGSQNVTSRGFRDTVSKCIQYGSFLIITHVLTHFQIDGDAVLKNLQWFDKIAFEFLIFIEMKSVYENITTINPKFDYIQVGGEKIVIFIERYLKKNK